MKKFKFLSLILMVSVIMSVFASPMAQAVSDPAPGANAVMLIDTATGNPLYVKNENAKVFPASTTKIMTVLLAVEAIEQGTVTPADAVTASDKITFDLISDGSSAGIVPGEVMSLENLMYCAMIASANEACNVIAEHVGGSIPSFVEKMNARAKELGCTGTNFTNTHGLPNDNHYTTAKDFSLIAAEAIKHPLLMQICNTVSKIIPATNKAAERNLSNTNGLINTNSTAYPGYFYEYAAGIKTGHTDGAGYCLISTATKNGVSLLAVVMGGKAVTKGEKTDFGNFSDSIKLYNWAFENFSYRDIIKTTTLVEDVPVKMGSDADFVTVHPQGAVRVLLANDEDTEAFEQKITIFNEESGEELVAPITAGQVLGEITIERDGVVYGKSQLVASTSVDLSYARFIKTQILNTLKNPIVIIAIIVVLALLGAYIFLVIRYRRARKQHMQEVSRRRKLNERIADEAPKGRGPKPPEPRNVLLKYFEDDDKSADNAEAQTTDSAEEMDFGEINLDPEPTQNENVETQAERDYFTEFFSKNK
ncbi:MAG: D-alanyl-D-alanine carboxypeptidase family protein [Oscillospiraceae bacterium]